MTFKSGRAFDQAELGRIIDDARIEAGIRVIDLCNQIGMSASTYTVFKKGSH